MATITVSDVFDKEGAITGGSPLFRKLDTLVDSDDIHGIDLTELIGSYTDEGV